MLVRTVGLHHPDVELAALLLGEGDQLAVRTPDRRRVAPAPAGDAVRARAVGVHDVELRRAAAVGVEHHLAAVRRERGRGVDGRIGGETRGGVTP